MIKLNELNKAMLEAMKVIAPEEVKCLRKMEKERGIIYNLMVSEDEIGQYGTSSFREVLKVVDSRIDDWYVRAVDTVTEFLVYDGGKVEPKEVKEWSCDDFSAEDIAVKQWASGYEPKEEEEEEEWDYEWITTIPRPNHNPCKPDSDDGDVYEHLDCDGTAW